MILDTDDVVIDMEDDPGRGYIMLRGSVKIMTNGARVTILVRLLIIHHSIMSFQKERVESGALYTFGDFSALEGSSWRY